MNPLTLNADDLQRWRQCERRFWLHRQTQSGARALDSSAGDADGLLPEQANVDAALRASFPAAKIIPVPASATQWPTAIERTLDVLDVHAVPAEGWAIFGACLASPDRAQARIDVLDCGERGLRIFKVCPSTAGSEADIDCVAFWTHVAARCGLQVQSAGLLLIALEFVYPGYGCYAGVFRELDLGPVLGSRPIAAWLNAMRNCAYGPQPPPNRGAQCGGCEFEAGCAAEQASDGPAKRVTAAAACAALEVLGRELAAELRAEGHADLRSVAPERIPNARHRRALHAVQRGAPVLEPAVAAIARNWGWPRCFLRIDTIGFAVPVWSGTRPYQTLPFQWVCDVQTRDGRLERRAYLAEAGGDLRRAFAESLLEALGDGISDGLLFAYNAGFERNRLRELARIFDDLSPALVALEARIVDLFQIGRAHYYHPAMAGSWSFRSICHAVAPDLDIDWRKTELAPSVPAAFARLLRLDPTARQPLREALLGHAQRQAQALRRIAALFESGDADATAARAKRTPQEER